MKIIGKKNSDNHKAWDRLSILPNDSFPNGFSLAIIQYEPNARTPPTIPSTAQCCPIAIVEYHITGTAHNKTVPTNLSTSLMIIPDNSAIPTCIDGKQFVGGSDSLISSKRKTLNESPTIGALGTLTGKNTHIGIANMYIISTVQTHLLMSLVSLTAHTGAKDTTYIKTYGKTHTVDS